MTDGERIEGALRDIAAAIRQHAKAVADLSESTRAIAHGPLSGPNACPGGIEGLTMAICGGGRVPGERGSLVDALESIAASIGERP